MSEQEKNMLPEIMFFAGPNGSGKSTITRILHVYDNSDKPYRIFKKRKDAYFRWENEFWNVEAIEKLTGIGKYSEYKKV